MKLPFIKTILRFPCLECSFSPRQRPSVDNDFLLYQMNWEGCFFFRLGHRFSGTKKKKKSKPFVNINTCSWVENAEAPTSPTDLWASVALGGCSFTKSLILTSLPNKQHRGDTKKQKNPNLWSLGRCSGIFINNDKKKLQWSQKVKSESTDLEPKNIWLHLASLQIRYNCCSCNEGNWAVPPPVLYHVYLFLFFCRIMWWFLPQKAVKTAQNAALTANPWRRLSCSVAAAQPL